MRIVDL